MLHKSETLLTDTVRELRFDSFESAYTKVQYSSRNRYNHTKDTYHSSHYRGHGRYGTMHASTDYAHQKQHHGDHVQQRGGVRLV